MKMRVFHGFTPALHRTTGQSEPLALDVLDLLLKFWLFQVVAHRVDYISCPRKGKEGREFTVKK